MMEDFRSWRDTHRGWRGAKQREDGQHEEVSNDPISLFIDDLPLDMAWVWLLQIFRGEGEVVDGFVSHKNEGE